ncbi:hypothetical protein HBI52_165360 [Parastagonospora nodorum]|nr:hypothetical protein HBH46_148060 [Parastagonospora nodorum]KAH5186290.1 hypothetical protein HBH68_168060 [Parastagonospora nodorum]KAH5351102.1 hypothetical protein HBI48_163820 [Parastagonospora nodorum]KAH5502738.1 hypothetical protein HBI52_165360 [Parastagonospora nodorum]KAH6212643.1 hypothetical protein HBI15_143410 [Parastagonospora nodorum]
MRALRSLFWVGSVSTGGRAVRRRGLSATCEWVEGQFLPDKISSDRQRKVGQAMTGAELGLAHWGTTSLAQHADIMTRDHGRDKAFHDGGRVRISVQDAQERTWHSQSRGETGERFGALAALVVVSVGKSAATSLLCRFQQERGDVDTSRKGVVLHRKFSGGILSAHLRLKAANFAQPPEVSLASTELLVVKARPRPMSGARFAYLVHGRRVQLRTWNVQQLHQESVFQQSRQHASRPGRVDTLLSR